MRTEKQKWYKLLALVIAISLCIPMLSLHEAKAEEEPAVNVYFTRMDHSRWGTDFHFPEGIYINTYYDLATIDGNSGLIQRVNASLREGYDSFTHGQYVGSLTNQGYDKGKQNYVNGYSGRVAQNTKGYISIAYIRDWNMGGVGDGSHSGITVSMATGERLYLSDLETADGSAITFTRMYNIAVNYYRDVLGISYRNMYTESFGKTNLNDLNFYIENNEIILCIQKYELAFGAAGSHAIPTGIYVKDIQVSGWKLDGNKWWYQNYDGTYPVSQWQPINDSWYYFGSDGYMLTDWQRIDNRWYWLGMDGAMRIGWQKISGVWYWFNAEGSMETGWQNIGGIWYWFNASGAMETGWQNIGGTWYWFDAAGAMKTGWQKIDNNWYYFTSSGAMVTGEYTIGNTIYHFDGSGAWVQ